MVRFKRSRTPSMWHCHWFHTSCAKTDYIAT